MVIKKQKIYVGHDAETHILKTMKCTAHKFYSFSGVVGNGKGKGFPFIGY
jgi:hypothetical protein